MIRCAGLSGLRKIPGDVCYPFFLGKKNVHIFTRFDCLLSSSLGAVKSLPDFNVKISSMWDDGIFEHPRATPIISKCRWLFPVGSGLKSSKIQGFCSLYVPGAKLCWFALGLVIVRAKVFTLSGISFIKWWFFNPLLSGGKVDSQSGTIERLTGIFMGFLSHSRDRKIKSAFLGQGDNIFPWEVRPGG